MEQLALIIMAILMIAMAYIIYNLRVKNIVLRKYVEESDKDYYAAVNVVSFVHRLVSEAYASLLRIDKRGGFSSDDEVGFTFRAIFESVQQSKVTLDNLIKLRDGDSGKPANEEEGKE